MRREYNLDGHLTGGVAPVERACDDAGEADVVTAAISVAAEV
jgi:hypothetical protein